MRTRHTAFAVFFCVLSVALAQDDGDDDPDAFVGKGDALEGIQPVAATGHVQIDADSIDEEHRPPGIFGNSQEEDLGAVETLTSAPTPEELEKIKELAANSENLDESLPPSHSSHHTKKAASPIAPRMAPSSLSSRSGFDSRATVAYDTANKAIERAKRAAEEAKLAIAAAEAAKHQADEVVRRGGDGGPALDAQGLLALGDGESGEDTTFKALEQMTMENPDAADLGLPNPNIPKLSLEAHRRGLDEVNHAQLGEVTFENQSQANLRQKLMKVVMDPPARSDVKRTHDEGEGDEEEFKHHHHHHHHGQQQQEQKHVSLPGDSIED